MSDALNACWFDSTLLNKKSCYESKVTFDIELWGLDKALSFCWFHEGTDGGREREVEQLVYLEV